VSLENLLKIELLKEHPVDADEVERLLAAAERNISDASAASISAETRFDAAYKAIMQSALAAMHMHGYRPNTNKPGHHVTVVQSLPLTVGIDRERAAVLDTFRRQRNLTDYTGNGIDESSVQYCIDEARWLLKQVVAWRKAHRSQLVPKK
jgi:uncharacterized protein (UPF0332 family)